MIVFTPQMLIIIQLCLCVSTNKQIVWNIHDMEEKLYNFMQLHSVFQTTTNYLNNEQSVIYNPQVQFFGEIYNDLLTNNYYNFTYGAGIKYQLRLKDVYNRLIQLEQQEINQTKKNWIIQMKTKIKKFDADKNLIQYVEDKILMTHNTLEKHISELNAFVSTIITKLSGQLDSNQTQKQLDLNTSGDTYSEKYYYSFTQNYEKLQLQNKTNINRTQIPFDSVLPCSNTFKNVIIIIDRWEDFSLIDNIIMQTATKNDHIWFFYNTVNIVEQYINETFLYLQNYIYVKDYLQQMIQDNILTSNQIINKKQIQQLVNYIEQFDQTTYLVMEIGKRSVKDTNSILLMFVNDIYLIYNTNDILQFDKDILVVIFTDLMEVQSYNILRTRDIYFYNSVKDLDKYLILINQKYFVSSAQFQVINGNVVFCKGVFLNYKYIGTIFSVIQYYDVFYQKLNIWPDSVSVIQVAYARQVILNSNMQYLQPYIMFNNTDMQAVYQILPIENGYKTLNTSISNVIQERFLSQYFLSGEDMENYYQYDYQTIFYNKYLNNLQITIQLSQFLILTQDRITVNQTCKDITKDQFIAQLAQFQQDAPDMNSLVSFISPSHVNIKEYCLKKQGNVCITDQQQTFQYTNIISNKVYNMIKNQNVSTCSYQGLPDGFYFLSIMYFLMTERSPKANETVNNTSSNNSAYTTFNNTPDSNSDHVSFLDDQLYPQRNLFDPEKATTLGVDPGLKFGNATECFNDYLAAIKSLINDNNSTKYNEIIQKYMAMLNNDIDQQFDFTYYVMLEQPDKTYKKLDDFMQVIPENQKTFFPHLFLYLDQNKNEILYYKSLAYLHQSHLAANSKYNDIYLAHNYIGSYYVSFEQEMMKYTRRQLNEYKNSGRYNFNTVNNSTQSQMFNHELFQLREKFAVRFATYIHHNYFMYTNDLNASKRYQVILSQVGSQVNGLSGQYRLDQIGNKYYVTKPIIVDNKNINGLQQINGYITVSLNNIDLNSYFDNPNPYIFFSTTGQVLKSNIEDTTQLSLARYIVIQQLLLIQFLKKIEVRYTSFDYSPFISMDISFWNTSWQKAQNNKFTIFFKTNKSDQRETGIFYKLLSEYEYNKTQIWERIIVIDSNSNLSMVSRFSVQIPKILQGFIVYFEDGLLSISKDQNMSFLYKEMTEDITKNTHAAINGTISPQYLSQYKFMKILGNQIFSQNMTNLPDPDTLIYDSMTKYQIITIIITVILIATTFYLNKYFIAYINKQRLPLIELLADAEKNKALAQLQNRCSEIYETTDYDQTTNIGNSNSYLANSMILSPRDEYKGIDIDAVDIQYLFRQDYLPNLRGTQHLQKQILKPNNLFTILCYNKRELQLEESFQFYMHVVQRVRMQEQLKAPYPADFLRETMDGYEPQPSLAVVTPERVGNFYDKVFPACTHSAVRKKFPLPPPPHQIPIPKFYDFDFLEMFERDDNYTPLEITIYEKDKIIKYHNKEIIEKNYDGLSIE